MARWIVHVYRSQVHLGQFSQDFENEPMVGKEFEIDRDIPGGRIPRGRYKITSVNVHCSIIVINPIAESSAMTGAPPAEPEGN